MSSVATSTTATLGCGRSRQPDEQDQGAAEPGEQSMEKLLQLAREADSKFQAQNTPLDDWLDVHRLDVWATKNDGLDEGEFTNGAYYPDKKHIKDPRKTKQWGNDLYTAVQELVRDYPGITTKGIREHLSADPKYVDILDTFQYIFEVITTHPIQPPYYMEMFNRMCDAQVRILDGGDVDIIEAELEARNMKCVREAEHNNHRRT